MDRKPKVSICIPTYNQRPEFLRECIQSALNQRYDSFEVIVSDNHSTNGVPEILAQFKDSRLRIVKPPVHLSMAGNFEFCASQSVGEYLCFLSSDDLMYPDCCSRLASILDAHPNVVFAHCASRMINERGDEIGFRRSDHKSFIRKGIQELQRYILDERDAFVGIHIRRTAYEAVGGIEDNLNRVMDWYLSIKLTTVGDVAYCDEVLSAMRYWLSDRYPPLSTLNLIRDIRLMYEWLETSNIIELIEGDKRTLRKARKKHAYALSTNPYIYRCNPIEKEQALQEIIMLDNSYVIRLRLNLVRLGMLPLFTIWVKTWLWLSRRINSFLYMLSDKRSRIGKEIK